MSAGAAGASPRPHPRPHWGLYPRPVAGFKGAASQQKGNGGKEGLRDVGEQEKGGERGNGKGGERGNGEGRGKVGSWGNSALVVGG